MKNAFSLTWSQRMSNQPSVIIDDIEPTLARLTPLGQTIMSPLTNVVRDAMLEFAAARGWQVIPHMTFSEWALRRMQDDRSWLVLDPLFSAAELGARGQIARFTRSWTRDTWGIDPGYSELGESEGITESVGILDDSAATGMTLHLATRIANDSGARVHRFLTCTGTAFARSAMNRIAPGAEWLQFVEGESISVHMRDACPCLPFAGRGNRDQPIINTAAGRIYTRLTHLRDPSGLWSQLCKDANVFEALRLAQRSLPKRLSAHLGRKATVTDLRLLGTDVVLSLNVNTELSGASTLESLLR